MRLILDILYAMCGYKKAFLCVSYCTYCMQCVALKKHFYASHIAHIVCNVWLLKNIFMRLILHILYAMCGYKMRFYASHVAHIVCNVWL